jgi:hypothetical protein
MDKETKDRLVADHNTLVYLLNETCDMEKDWHWVDSRAKVIQQTVEDLKNTGELELKSKECAIEERKLALDEKYRPLELEEVKNKNETERTIRERECSIEERKISLEEKYRPLEMEEEHWKNAGEMDLRMKEYQIDEKRLAFEEQLKPLELDIEKMKLELEKKKLAQELKIAEVQEKGSRIKLFVMAALGLADLGSRAYFTMRISKKELTEPLLTQSDTTLARMAIKDTPLFSKLFK